MRIESRYIAVHNHLSEIGDIMEHRVKLHQRKYSLGKHVNRIDNGSQIHPRNRPYGVEMSDVSEKDVDGREYQAHTQAEDKRANHREEEQKIREEKEKRAPKGSLSLIYAHTRGH